jgi:hypothetical protein
VEYKRRVPLVFLKGELLSGGYSCIHPKLSCYLAKVVSSLMSGIGDDCIRISDTSCLSVPEAL